MFAIIGTSLNATFLSTYFVSPLALSSAASLSQCLLLRETASRLKTKVNCWFCQHDQRVPYEQRNSFVCSSCEQYNGFNESGGYNRKVPGQHCFGATVPTRRFCTPAKSSLLRPDVVPHEGYASNGLCDNCNRQQEIIMRKIADFEPLDERKYANLIALKNVVANSIVSGFTSVTKMASKVVRRRRLFFAGGFMVELLHAVTFVLAVLIFFSQFNYLQEDAGLDLIRVPLFLQRTLPGLLTVAYHLVGALLCAHVITLWTNKCRTTLPDLMLPVVAGLHLVSFTFPDEMYREDLALFRCAFACFETLLSTAVTFVPRKRIHKTRPNRMLSSAFSIASTPMSQCSSQATSANNSMLLDRTLNTSENRDKFPKTTPTLAIRQRNKWRERQQTPEPSNTPKNGRIRGDYEVAIVRFLHL
ncbi:unnamed protein product [Nippostrongylus brasiliensis]|uniref:Transmembrane protein 201 (inferred by orthology to a human protein) n=1 Tax=Nippostrongylus brasiliensis TaxID=27835 RepID=A0A0N4Y5X2_NIPBR|nr:unnamed protein product [Nippostrongylus brasiliensis]